MGMVIHVYSHGFVVSTLERKFKWVTGAFIRNRLIVDKFQMGKNKERKGKVFASYNSNHSMIFLPISLFDDFKIYLIKSGIRESEYSVKYHKPSKGEKVDINFIANFKMSDLQERCLSFIRDDSIRKIAPLQTGKGKTALALYYMCEYGRRTMITMNAKYLTRWVMDLVGEDAKVDLLEEDLIVVRGLKDLKKYILGVVSGEIGFKLIMISNTTMGLFIDDVLENPKEWKSLKIKVPNDIFSVLKIGLRIRDEAHEHLHFNFKFDLFTHCSKTIDLSATLIFDDQGMERMSRIVYPMEDRFDQGKWDTHVEAYSVNYSLKPSTKLKWTQGWNGPYNHNQFETSILNNPTHLSSYKNIIKDLVSDLYVNANLEGEKRGVCIVFASTKDMCTRITDYLQRMYPDMAVNRKIGGDDYEELLTGDILVSTPKSAGTAVDIPNLSVVINTVNISSTQAIVQMIGRLRPNPEFTCRFYYLTCVSIPQHIKYNVEKQTKLRGVVNKLSSIDTLYYM